ncbi:MAG: hypothetical protein E7520_00650 [Ruminococcaceae bacterium]|jgi:hypothetical protein|nr:hypothetical protein [Oscillospiraceae bacterium]
MNNRTEKADNCKKNKSQIIATLLLFIFMLSMSSAVYASSYTTYVKFKHPYSGVTRSFDGNNIKYSATMKSSKSNDTGKYTVTLQRKSGLWALDVGHKTLNRVGAGTAKWSNVGPGNYRLHFDKTNDGYTLSSNNVVIKNY